MSHPVHYVTDAAGPSNVFYSLLRLHARYDNSMPQGIVVGLSSDDQEHNLHVEKGAKAYLDFLEMEVIPFIEGHYRTASFRSIAGHSLGGGFAIYAFLNRNDLFNACIAGSPYPLAYLSNEIDSGAAFINTEAYRFLYASIGTVNDISMPEFDRFIETISEVAPDNLKLHFQIHDGENHASNVAVNFQDGLEALYADWKFVLPDTPGETVDALLARHYDRLSKKIGYLVKPDEWEVIFPVMDALAKRGDFDNAIRVIKYGLELYPRSDQAYAFLAQAYVSIGDKESASVNVEKALSINPQNKFALHVKRLLDN
jgi:tetratricopeptide (TPR) repeat protein